MFFFLSIIYLFFFNIRFSSLKTQRAWCRRKFVKFVFFTIRSKKSSWFFCQTQFWCRVLCCFEFYFRFQYNPKNLAQMSGNGILWSMWITPAALTGKEEFEQQLKVLKWSIDNDQFSYYQQYIFHLFFFHRLTEPQLSVHLNNL